jgi:hypothetical protein
MFGPENAFISNLEKLRLIQNISLKARLIGCPCVSVDGESSKKGVENVRVASARKFLESIISFKGNDRQIYDNRIYYLPFFAQYFNDLEKAFENISRYLTDKFEGYIIVVNNTHRKRIVPVAESVVEIWQNLGFYSEIVPELTRELSHVGGINPNVKGLSSRHYEYTIRIER